MAKLDSKRAYPPGRRIPVQRASVDGEEFCDTFRAIGGAVVERE